VRSETAKELIQRRGCPQLRVSGTENSVGCGKFPRRHRSRSPHPSARKLGSAHLRRNLLNWGRNEVDSLRPSGTGRTRQSPSLLRMDQHPTNGPHPQRAFTELSQAISVAGGHSPAVPLRRSAPAGPGEVRSSVRGSPSPTSARSAEIQACRIPLRSTWRPFLDVSSWSAKSYSKARRSARVASVGRVTEGELYHAPPHTLTLKFAPRAVGTGSGLCRIHAPRARRRNGFDRVGAASRA
jgi:hypothetical protein